MNQINMVPEFSSDEGMGKEEVVKTTEATIDEVVEEEKETPTEPPADKEPTEEVEEKPDRDDAGLIKQVQGLQTEKEKLLAEIRELRGTRREIKQEELVKVEQKIDDLKDVNPGDVELIDKVLRSKGYVTKAESQKMFYESVKQEELGKFLEKFPEYKPENDPNDLNWSALQRELRFYRMPDNPREISDMLLRAHKAIAKAPSDHTVEARQERVKTASVGSARTASSQRSSNRKSLDPEQRARLEQGGWSEEEIQSIESKL